MAPGRIHSAGNANEISAIETKKPEPVMKKLLDNREDQGTSCSTANVQHPQKKTVSVVMIFMQGFSVRLNKVSAIIVSNTGILLNNVVLATFLKFWRLLPQ